MIHILYKKIHIVARPPALAAWLVSLGQRFHEQGAVPIVYLYLIFGSIILVMMIAQSLGVLLFYWIGVGNAEG